MEKTVTKALRLLEMLAAKDSACGVSELGRALGLTKSNVHRLLETLVHAGYARRQAESGRYEPSLKIWELGTAVVSRLDLKRVANHYLHALAARTGESVHLSIFDDGEVVYIDKVESSQPVRAYSRIGGRAPAYCVATGKVLLAHQPRETIDRIATRLVPFTSRTIMNGPRLHEELARVRRDGFAANTGEWSESVCGVAAPIHDGAGTVVAAVGISGPAERLRPRARRVMALLVLETAARISRELGFQPLSPGLRGSRGRSSRTQPAVPALP